MTEKSPNEPDSCSVGQLVQHNSVENKDQIIHEHIGWMLALAERILGDHALAQDAVQEAFCNAFRAHHKLKDQTKLKPWLKRIVINAALMQLRQQNQRSEQSIDDYLPEFDSNACRLEDRWSYLTKIEAVVENQHLTSLVHQSFTLLPAEYRIVIQLRDIEGYDTREVAEQLDISTDNVKVRLHRARSALKKILEPMLRGDTC